MVRITLELINTAPGYINTLGQRELSLRGYLIPMIENLGRFSSTNISQYIIQ